MERNRWMHNYRMYDFDMRGLSIDDEKRANEGVEVDRREGEKSSPKHESQLASKNAYISSFAVEDNIYIGPRISDF